MAPRNDFHSAVTAQTPNRTEKIEGLITSDPSTGYGVTREGQRRQRAVRVGLRGSKTTHYTLAEKLDARTTKTPTCWIVSGYALPRNGHVQISHGGKVQSVSRAAYELHHGPIPPGLVVAHVCDNPRCVRPDHLVATTQGENVRDSIRKGRYNAFGRQKLNEAQIFDIRRRAAAGETYARIAWEFGIKRHTVSGIVHRRSWAHLSAEPVNGPRPVHLLNDVLEPVRTVEVPVLGTIRFDY